MKWIIIVGGGTLLLLIMCKIINLTDKIRWLISAPYRNHRRNVEANKVLKRL